MTRYSVQECGCIAIPEDVQKVTGLYPGASFELRVADDGSSVTLTSIQPSAPAQPARGVLCGSKPEQ